MTRLALALPILLALPAAAADAPRFDLTLTKATAERFGNDQVLIRCEVVLENNTNRVVNVRSTFFSAFDGLMLVVRDAKGKELVRRPYILHQSPMAPPGKDYPLKPGKNEGELRFPLDLPKDAKQIRVMLAGNLPGSGYDDLLLSDVVVVDVPAAK